MRKYTIPKVTYVLLILVLACLSIGYTYAYFSSIATAESATSLGKINIVWRAIAGEKTGEVTDFFADASNIQISELVKLKRGGCSPLTATDKTSKEVDLKLQISNSNNEASVPAYCRIKIEAKYTPINGTATNCKATWIQLALNDGANDTFITELDENRWFYEEVDEYNGYYYFGTKSGSGESITRSLTPLPAGESKVVANRVYLSDSAPAEVLGSRISIKLILEGVQSSHDAYQSVWGVTWENTIITD